MPVYHYTFHAYGSWLPDRPEGYTPHGQSFKPADPAIANEYRKRMRRPETHFGDGAKQHALQTLIDSQSLQHFELYAMAAEPSHLHVVVAWRDEREPTRVRSQVKTSLTRALNKHFGKRDWFVAKAGQTPVVDEAHLHELVHSYLPKHGLYWKRGDDQEDA
ncbi:MAG: hypothetical protein ACE37H_14105 [Phycisphaeraceae bacterium]